VLAGIVGKPNVGKSTFFNAATLLNVPVANYPFTTVKPNFGTAYIRVKCVHEEFGVSDNPVNSACVNGTRLIPVRIVDVAGLVPGPQREEGWGTNFLTIFVRQTFYCTLSMLRALLMKRGGWFDQVRTTLLRTWNLSKKRSFNGSFRLLKETGLRWPAQLRLEVSQKQE